MSKIQLLIELAKALAPHVADLTAALKAAWDIIQQFKGDFDITPQASVDADAVVAELTALGVDEAAARELIA